MSESLINQAKSVHHDDAIQRLVVLVKKISKAKNISTLDDDDFASMHIIMDHFNGLDEEAQKEFMSQCMDINPNLLDEIQPAFDLLETIDKK